ncbi:hypothetical protein Lalb_Chr00c34g0408481 [Lupinus albus]|uniref:Uncharacterized protein n=1 Tax=Lupinus albus TaxID=3870 RepID=A0A6A4NC56_LUPAL|nr:hypothetical protein Lalb_Chr00c34g0408481 [Lupinus albus]
MTHLDKSTDPFLSPAVVVFNLNKPGNIEKAIKGERVGTLIGQLGILPCQEHENI